jgi:hypothetical protein
LLRAGRAKVVYEFKALEEKRAAQLLESLGKKGKDDMTLAEIFNAPVKGLESVNKQKGPIGFGK